MGSMDRDRIPSSTPEAAPDALRLSDNLATQPLASLVGDTGADTFRRFHAQVEYTALWCVRLLCPEERLEAVVPESFEDMMLVRALGRELHQVKTRDPHLADWTFAELVPVMARMYSRGRSLTDKPVSYRFVTNHPCNARTEHAWGATVSLRAFKRLLDVRAMGQAWTAKETEQYRTCCEVLIPRIREIVDSPTSAVEVEALLAATVIDSQSTLLHYPNQTDEHCPRNIVQLGTVLRQQFPGGGHAAIHELAKMSDRLLRLVDDRITRGTSLETRQIIAQDVHNCRSEANLTVQGHPEIEAAPGATRLEKKVRLGGFDDPRVEVIQMQQAQAEIVRRRLPVGLQGDAWDMLTVSLLDCQVSAWEAAQRDLPGTVQLGTTVLERIRTRLPEIAQACLPGRGDINDSVCFGVLWQETARCRAYWHGKPGATR